MRATGLWGLCLVIPLLAGCDRPPEASSTEAAVSPAPVAEAAPRVPKRYDIGTLLSNLRLVGADMSPDGSRVLFSSNASGVFNLYEIPASGGEPVALTASTTDAHFAVGYFPADGRMLYTADRGGDERNHLYVREVDASARDLTPCEKCKAQFLDWAADDAGFFVMTNERDERFFDVYEIAAAGYARSTILQNASGDMPVAVSRDRRHVALSRANSTNDSDILLHDRQTGELRNLTAHEGMESNDAMAFTPDGGLLYLSNRGGEFSRLLRMDLATGESRVLYETGWDVSYAEYTPDDSHLLVYVNADARTRLLLLDAATLAPVPLPAVPSGDVTG
ncbi:MAG: TolB family protein, partial [Gammaproteobacteria bacterium]